MATFVGISLKAGIVDHEADAIVARLGK